MIACAPRSYSLPARRRGDDWNGRVARQSRRGSADGRAGHTKRVFLMHPGLQCWLAWAAWLEMWHSFEVEGVEILDRSDPVMIVGYHGRAVAHDLIVLNKILFERHGKLPVSVVHRRFDE